MQKTVLILLLASCATKAKDAATTGGGASSSGGGSARAAKVNLALSVVHGSASRDASLARDTSKGVSATGSGLTSLKLHIGQIALCENVTFNGSAPSPSNCLTLYAGPVDAALSDGSAVAAALTEAATVTDGYIDVLDATSRVALSQSVSITQAGSYNYVIFNWDPPIKITATLTDPADGTTAKLYTKASAPGTCAVNGNPAYACAVATSPLTAPPAAEAIMIGGGNIAMKFQNPLTISADDIANGTAYALTLAFNPDGLIQGVTGTGATNFPPYTDNTIGNGNNVGNTINMVGAQLAAILHSTTSSVSRESYSATVSEPDSSTYKLRIELFSVDGDATHTVYGVTTATIPTAATDGYLIGWEGIYGVTTNADGSINLLDYKGDPQLANFQRVAAAGGTTTGDLTCDGVTMNCSAGATVSATFALDTLDTL